MVVVVVVVICYKFKLLRCYCFCSGMEPDAVNFWFGDGRAVTSREFITNCDSSTSPVYRNTVTLCNRTRMCLTAAVRHMPKPSKSADHNHQQAEPELKAEQVEQHL